MMQGGLKVYRGSASAARHYVEAGHSRVDDYYLAEGTGLAERFTASPDGGVTRVGSLDGDGYEAWASGVDPATGVPRGRLRTDANAVRFVEVVVNGPKSWSLAAALHSDIGQAYDAAMDRAATQIIGWLGEHATTRVGPRGRQVQVLVEQLEAVTVRHHTSRAGDPHRHLHLQVNARVFADGAWRGLHTVGVRDSLDAINGIGHAAMVTDPAFRAALAAHGFTVDPSTGELRELQRFVGAFSARARQITRNLDRYEAQWRQAHPGQEPGPRLRRAWDSRAWAEARPDKVVPTSGAELEERWNDELFAAGYSDPPPTQQIGASVVADGTRPGALDRDQGVAVVLSRLGARRSAWNSADIRGEVERWIAATGLVTDAAVRIELAEDLTHRAAQACVPMLDQPDVPEHVRAMSSPAVLKVEADLVARLTRRASDSSTLRFDPRSAAASGLDGAQRDAVGMLAARSALLVVEGAAGSGKTRTLAAAHAALAARGHRMVVLTPTLKAAQVARREVGEAYSAAWLAHQHGWRWDEHGSWTRLPAEPDLAAVLRPGDLVVVDEAGMLDQDTARALLTIANEAGARLALVGDRHQLPAVGRGGVLDLALRWTPPEAWICLDAVHRFADPEYAALTLAMRTGTSPSVHAPPDRCGAGSGDPAGEPPGEPAGEVFDALWSRGHLSIHATKAERTDALADTAATALVSGCLSGGARPLVMADTHDQVAALNGAIRERLVAAGAVDDTRVVTTTGGERLGVGDRIATRRNDRDLGVANRDTWTITHISDDGSLTVSRSSTSRSRASGGDHGANTRTLPAAYVIAQVELAYATTVYGAQGETTHTGHLVLGEHTTGAAAYVGMTRGRDHNVAHLVADDLDQARALWQAAFRRDPADLGPGHAAQRAADDVHRYGTLRPLPAALSQLRAAWTAEQDLHDRLSLLGRRREMWGQHGDYGALRVAEIDADLADLTDRLPPVTRRITGCLNEPAIRALSPDRIAAERATWLEDRRVAGLVTQQAVALGEQTPRPSRHQPAAPPTRPPVHGRGFGR